MQIGNICESCLITYYLSSLNCLPCSDDCDSCDGSPPSCDIAGCSLYHKNDGSGNCICDTNLFLHLGSCISVCPNPYYENAETNT